MIFIDLEMEEQESYLSWLLISPPNKLSFTKDGRGEYGLVGGLWKGVKYELENRKCLLGKYSKTEINSIQVKIYEWKIKYGSPFLTFFL